MEKLRLLVTSQEVVIREHKEVFKENHHRIKELEAALLEADQKKTIFDKIDDKIEGKSVERIGVIKFYSCQNHGQRSPPRINPEN